MSDTKEDTALDFNGSQSPPENPVGDASEERRAEIRAGQVLHNTTNRLAKIALEGASYATDPREDAPKVAYPSFAVSGLQDIVYITAFEQAHAQLHLAQVYDKLGNGQLAWRSLKATFQLDELCGVLGDEEIGDIINLLIHSESRGAYLRDMSSATCNAKRIAAEVWPICQRASQSAAYLRTVAERQELDEAALIFHANELAEFSRVHHDIRQLAPILATAIYWLSRRSDQSRRGLAVRYRSPREEAHLSQALVILGHALLELPLLNSRQQLLHCQRHIRTIRKDPVLQSDPIWIKSAYFAAEQGWALTIKLCLLDAPSSAGPDRRMAELVCAGIEVGCARATLPEAASSDIENIVAYSIGLFRLLHADSANIGNHVQAGKTLGKLLVSLRRFHDAAEVYASIADSEVGSVKVRDQFHRLTALALRKHGASILQQFGPQDVVAHDQAQIAFSQAADRIVTAAQVWESGVNPGQSPCLKAQNATTHFELAAIYAAAGQRGEARCQALMALCGTSGTLMKLDLAPDELFLSISIEEWLGALDETTVAEGAARLLEKVLPTLAPELALRGRRVMRHLFIMSGQESKSQQIGIEILRQFADTQPTPLNTSLLSVATNFREMSRYPRELKDLLDHGQNDRVISEVPQVLDMSRNLSYDGQESDGVLQWLLARAYRQVGKLADAQALLEAALVSGDTRHQSVVRSELGRVLISQGKLDEGSDQLQKAYDLGHHSGALLLAAQANRRRRRLDIAEEQLHRLLADAEDPARDRVRTELALLAVQRFRSPADQGGGRIQDIQRACQLVLPVISGEIGREGDFLAATILADISDLSPGANETENLLRSGSETVRAALLRALEMQGKFSERVLGQAVDLVRPDVGRSHSIVRPLSHYLMGAVVDRYQSCTREGFYDFALDLFEKLQLRGATRDFLAHLLAANKGVLIDAGAERLLDHLLDIISAPKGLGLAEELQHYLAVALPHLKTVIDTTLLAFAPRAYSGRDQQNGVDTLTNRVRRQCDVNRSHEAWLSQKMGPDIFVDGEPDAGGLESEYALSFLGSIFNVLEAIEPTMPMQIREVAVQLAQRQELADVSVRISFDENISIDSLHAAATAIWLQPDIQRWLDLPAFSAGIVPHMQVRVDRRDMVITAHILQLARITRHEWLWDPLYTYVVEETWNRRDLGPAYYPGALERMPSDSALNPSALASYVHVQLDGLVAQVFHTVLNDLGGAMAHIIMRTLTPGAVAMTMEQRYESLQNGLQQIRRTILDAEYRTSANRVRELDIVDLLRELSTEFATRQPQLVFSLAPENQTPIILKASRFQLEIALREIIMNAIKAVQYTESPPGAIRVSVTPQEAFVHVEIRNNGPSEWPDAAKGLGIGSKTVRNVVKAHGGTAHAHVLTNEGPWRWVSELCLPYAPARFATLDTEVR